MTTSFLEIQLDPQVSYGVQGGPMFKTTILTLSSGFERRNIDWSQARGQWDIAYGIRTQSEMDGVRSLFMACMGRAAGFRFKDWGDYNIVQQQIGTTDGATAAFQIYKTYTTIAGSFNRTINKPVAGTVNVWINNVPGVLGTDFTVDTTTGIITLLAPHVATTGVAISVAAQFDVPVRFDSDHFAPSLVDFNAFDWKDIVIVELRQ